MKFCPECGRPLVQSVLGGKSRMVCTCGFVDWGNSVNVGVVVVAFTERDEFMMVTLKGPEAGLLTFPGGFRELGESLTEAAKRETFEETGHTVEALQLYRVYAWDYKKLLWVVYKARLAGGGFLENAETEGLSFYSCVNPPPVEALRGPLTKELLNDLLCEPPDGACP